MLHPSVENRHVAARPAAGSQALVLSENATLSGKKSFLFEYLSPQERDYVIAHGEPRLARRSSTIFRQGDTQKGIYLINSGGVRVFYAAPSGREITRAYWFAGNFIGGPDVFAQNRNMWSAVAIRDTSLLLIPSTTLRTLCGRIPNLALGLIEAMVFTGRCYSAMTQMLGTRTAGERMLRVLLMLTEMYGEPCGEAHFAGRGDGLVPGECLGLTPNPPAVASASRPRYPAWSVPDARWRPRPAGRPAPCCIARAR